MSKLEKEIKSLIESYSSEKIGIGITTYNRRETFLDSLDKIKNFTHIDAPIVVVDDGSDKPYKEANYIFEKNVGIAKAKNKCIELLMETEADHFFLFDDDCFPISDNWHEPYVESDYKHHCFTWERNNKFQTIYSNSILNAFKSPCGCMIYIHRDVVNKIGGFNEDFNKWGGEHRDLSNRIFNAGFTPFRYTDVRNSNELFKSLDKEGKVKSTVHKYKQKKLDKINNGLLKENVDHSPFMPYKEDKNLIIACYFNSVADQRFKKKLPNDKEKVKLLIESVNKQNERAIILHDCFDDNDETFVQMETSVNPIHQCKISVYEYLLDNYSNIDNVFVVDSTDVELINPIDWDLVSKKLVVGDENKELRCKWMLKHHKDKFKDHKDKILLNSGIIGGNIDTVMEVHRRMIDLLPSTDAGDMAIFNRVCYDYFKEDLFYSRQVVTPFKEYEYNGFSWFKHK